MNLGVWDSHYSNLTELEPYGSDIGYEVAAGWVSGCATVEDWGCGKGWLRRFVPAERYTGIDGSASPFADIVTDLTTYRSSPEGIVLRAVLEHNYEWAAILDNALASFTKRLSILLFTPLVDKTKVLMTEPDYGDVPVIAFKLSDLTERIEAAGRTWITQAFTSATFYGGETALLVQ